MEGVFFFLHLLLMTFSRDGSITRVSKASNDCVMCHGNSKRVLETFFVAIALGRSTAWAASPSSSFGISAPAPIAIEALDFSGESSWAWGPNKNVTERSTFVNPVPSPLVKTQTSSSELCDKLNLTPKQKQMCVQGGEGLAETLLDAIRMSAYACQQQFEYERWNCSLSGYSRLLTLKKAYRETAVLYAFSAAGVAHAVAKACAAGRLRKCHCAEAENETETRETWRWGGCGDNLAYARTFANKFLDAGAPSKKPKPKPKKMKDSKRQTTVTMEQKLNKEMEAVTRALRRGKRAVTNNGGMRSVRNRNTQTTNGKTQTSNTSSDEMSGLSKSKKPKSETQRQRINRHNNAVGFEVVEQLVNRTCKCHGVSGSCSFKTCFDRLAAFTDTARHLKKKYDNAVQVGVEIRENSSQLRIIPMVTSPSSLIQTNRIVPQAPSRTKKAIEQLSKGSVKEDSKQTYNSEKYKKSELVFQQRSPDFCANNPLSPGTRDRRCLIGENCNVLCCGRGYNVHRLTVTSPCQCKLVLCCKVECQTCLTEKTIYTCK